MRVFGSLIRRFCNHKEQTTDKNLQESPIVFLERMVKIARKPMGDKIPFSTAHTHWNRLTMPIRKQRKNVELASLQQPHQILWQGKWVAWRGEFHHQEELSPSGSIDHLRCSSAKLFIKTACAK
tara:strand:+ start:134 stop:505 length:372 start_codon:yes stop_codon:yes gene_type:complete